MPKQLLSLVIQAKCQLVHSLGRLTQLIGVYGTERVRPTDPYISFEKSSTVNNNYNFIHFLSLAQQLNVLMFFLITNLVENYTILISYLN